MNEWRSNLNDSWDNPRLLIRIVARFNEIVEEHAAKCDSIHGLRMKLVTSLTVSELRSYEASSKILDTKLRDLKNACYERFVQLKKN